MGSIEGCVDLGEKNYKCIYCGALFWLKESIQKVEIDCEKLKFTSIQSPSFRKNRVFGAKFDVRKKFLSCYNLDQPFLKQLNHQGGFRSLDTCENFKHVGPILSSGSSDGYVIKGEENESISETGEPVTKVLSPGLPDPKVNGEEVIGVRVHVRVQKSKNPNQNI
ncbi:pheophytinase [Prunus dulcis]|uniref:Pheophytinase n=1 Tax=Prunus dulcis TaxID=3755 RepID=A0A5H2XZ25_PRUDU|nr:pheophytinase [Prunus dulcis]